MSLDKKAAKRIMNLKEARNSLQEENEQLREKLATLQRRQQVEELLLEARETDEAPERLKAASLERFLGLRAKMEEKSSDEIEKVASFLTMCDGDGGGLIPSDLPDPQGEQGFTEWLESV